MVVTQALVRELVRHFLRVGGYGGVPPLIYLRPDEKFYRAARRAGLRARTAADRRDHAWSTWKGRPRMWINTSRHTSLDALTDTCAHEAAHIVTGLAVHTGRFWACHKALLAGRMP